MRIFESCILLCMTLTLVMSTSLSAQIGGGLQPASFSGSARRSLHDEFCQNIEEDYEDEDGYCECVEVAGEWYWFEQMIEDY